MAKKPRTPTEVTTRTRSQYREFPPPTSLTERLVCIWTQSIDGSDGEYSHPILPDGCVDIVWIGRAAPVVAGPATHRVVVGLPAGTSLIGVRFQPGWAASSLGLPVNELLNQDVPLAEIWRHDADHLTEQIFKHRSVQDRLREMIAALTTRLTTVPDPDPTIQAAIQWLVGRPSGRVRDLALSIGLSDRQMQRRFVAAVGYGPKTFQRIMRFQRLLKQSAANVSDRLDLADLACGTGYADQAHMCREVRMLSGESPQTLLGQADSTLSMSDLFNTDDSDRDYSGHLKHPII